MAQESARPRLIIGAPASSRALPAMEQTSAEIFALTYGSLVRQLILDFEDLEEVNKQLETMGYNIGIRLIDEFLSRTRTSKCSNWKETAEVIAKQAFSMFLNVSCTVTNWAPDGKECSLVFTDNPLTEFVELPEDYKALKYCSILCGVIRGALEMVNMDVECRIAGDMLKGDDCHELRMRLKETRNEQFPYGEDD